MSNVPHLGGLGEQAAKMITAYLTNGALFVLVGRGPGIHSVVDRSGEFWTSETPVLGVLLRYLTASEARTIYKRHCEEYGDEQRDEVLLHAFFPQGRWPSPN